MLLNGNSSLSMKKWPRQLCPQHMIHHDTELPKEALRQNVLLIRQRMSQTNPSRLALRPSYIITIKKWRTRISGAKEAYITREALKPHLSFVHLLIEVPTPRVIWYDRWSRFLITLIWKLSKDALDSIYHLLRLLLPSQKDFCTL